MSTVSGDEFPDFLSEKLVMGESDPEEFSDFFLDAPYLDITCDNGDCPPPLFLLPPPPRPPDLAAEGCPALSPYESCDNIVIIDSQVHLEETFQNLIIVAVSSAVLVIALVLLVACIWRRRKSGVEGCHCGEGKQDNSGLQIPDSLEMKSASEVYDNPNYSHIMIGGKPFFLLPNGELSEHVPVPAQGEHHTPRHTQPHHIYEGGSSTYRSGSDYDTESSTYKPDSDRASNGFPPIYEEIDKCSSVGSNHNSQVESQFGRAESSRDTGVPTEIKGFVPHQTMAVIRKEESLPQTILHSERGPWSSHKSASPRRPGNRIPTRTPDSGSVYYYSDTLRRRGLLDTGRDSVQESDSGISSRSGHNTSSESTPQPRLELNRSIRGRHQPVVSSDEDLSQDIARRADRRGFVSPARKPELANHLNHVSRRQEVSPSAVIDTQIIVRNTNKREPRADL